MPLVNFTNLDFDQVKATLTDYIQSNSDFTSYDFQGSNLATIIDLLAYNTYITSYNANMVTNEVFIDSATLRENVVSLARNIGYVPRSKKASRSNISFRVNTANVTPTPSSLTLKAGPVAGATGGLGGFGGSNVFSILEDITVPVYNGIAEFNNITIYEGTILTSNYTYSSANLNQKFILPNPGIDTDLISVGVKSNEQSTASVTYKLQDSLFDINSTSNVYYIQEVEDEKYQIFFGDGTFGKALEEGNFITINYIVTNGDAANGYNSFSFTGRITYTRNAQTYTVTSGISLISTNTTSSGGESIESINSVKKYAPRIYASQNRCVTGNDYETLIPSRIYPETESISVFGGEELIPPQYGKVFISIKPKSGDFLPNLAKENIKMKLKKYAVAGIVPEILDLKYLFLEVNSKAYYNSNLAPSAEYVSTVIQNNANKYAESSEMNKYGARFKYSKFLKIIDDSSDAVTSNITTVNMRRDLRVSLNSWAEYIIGYGNAFHIRSMSGYNIKSSSFKVTGITENVYISDIPNANRTTGSLFLFTLPSINSTTPTIVRENIGSINYVSGIITINPINIQAGMVKNGQTIIEISVTPSSNDVIGLQDLYLQLDISSSTFEMVVDEIASGLDPSASNYIVSSSYANGSLGRSGGPATTVTATTTTNANVQTTTY